MKLFGPAGAGPVTLAGQTFEKLKEAPAPTSWNPDRTLPVVESDDPAVIQAGITAGWHEDHRKVPLTFDEEATKRNAKEEGDMLMASTTREVAAVLANQVAEARAEKRAAAKAAPAAEAPAKVPARKRASKAPAKAAATA